MLTPSNIMIKEGSQLRTRGGRTLAAGNGPLSLLKHADFTKNLLKQMSKTKPEELLTISDSKKFCSLSTDIDLNMTPHTLRNDKLYLQRKLSNSENKRL
jgi:hypothetical protein